MGQCKHKTKQIYFFSFSLFVIFNFTQNKGMIDMFLKEFAIPRLINKFFIIIFLNKQEKYNKEFFFNFVSLRHGMGRVVFFKLFEIL